MISSKRPTAPASGGRNFLNRTLKLGLGLPKICIQVRAKFQNFSHKTVILINGDVKSMESTCISLQNQRRLRKAERAFFGDNIELPCKMFTRIQYITTLHLELSLNGPVPFIRHHIPFLYVMHTQFYFIRTMKRISFLQKIMRTMTLITKKQFLFYKKTLKMVLNSMFFLFQLN